MSTTSRIPQKHVVILFNPFAGKGQAKSMALKAQQFAQEQGWHVTQTQSSLYAGHIENELAPAISEDTRLIILIGGDGTLRELISGLLSAGKQPEIAFIPMGNANVVARELGIPLSPTQALSMLKTSQAEAIDIGKVTFNEAATSNKAQLFLAMLEIGIGAKIVHLVNQLRKDKLRRLYQFWGDLVYALAGLLAFIAPPTAKVRCTITPEKPDSSRNFHTNQLVIANMQTYAKGWSFTPDAVCHDGKLDIALAKKHSRGAALSGFVAAARKKRQAALRVDYLQASHIQLQADSPLYMQIDGDPVSFSGSADINILPGACLIHTGANRKS